MNILWLCMHVSKMWMTVLMTCFCSRAGVIAFCRYTWLNLSIIDEKKIVLQLKKFVMLETENKDDTINVTYSLPALLTNDYDKYYPNNTTQN